MSELAVYDRIDLNRHAYIMASAGTGKTYTVQNFLLRMLLQVDEQAKNWKPRYQLPEILLVTYTEKATGELKDRIRKILSDALRQMKKGEVLCNGAGEAYYEEKYQSEFAAHIEKQLLNFDQARIFTIHGFCQRVLQENALLSGMPMEMEVSDGQDLAYRLVRDWWNREFSHWPELEQKVLVANLNPEEFLQSLLKLLLAVDSVEHVFPQLEMQDAQTWEKHKNARLAEVEQAAREVETKENELQAQEEKILSQVHHLAALAGSVDWDGFGNAVNQDATKKAGLWKNLHTFALQGYFRGPKKEGAKTILQVNGWQDLPKLFTANEWKPSAKLNQLLLGLPGWGEFYEAGSDLYVQFGEQKMLQKNHKAAEENYKELREKLRISLLHRLLHAEDGLWFRLHEELSAKGQLTFNEMVSKTASLLKESAEEEAQTSRARRLRSELRRQYKFAIIDEFQDTNYAQWSIFKPLFLEKADTQGVEEKERNLIVVGDPKQSIYAFQGAELTTCLRALNEIEQAGGVAWELDKNYRSQAPLIQAYDSLFMQKAWFGESAEEDSDAEQEKDKAKPLVYSGVGAGKEFSAEDSVYAHGLQSPLWLLDLQEVEGNKSSKEEVLAQWTVQHIEWMLNTPNLLGTDKNCLASDIAVLVQKRAEAKQIIQGLRQRGIPVSLGGENGLFQGRVARHLCVLIESFVYGAKENFQGREYRHKAYLSLFFALGVHDLEVQTLSEEEEISSSLQKFNSTYQQAEELWQSWQELAETGRWGRLFAEVQQSLVSRIVSDPLQQKSDVAALRQLSSYALRYLVGEKMSLSLFARRLRSLLMGELRESDEEEMYFKETSLPAVTIMTMHGSKGLEFPIVFCPSGAGTLRRDSDKDLYLTHSEGQGQEFHLDKEEVKDKCKMSLQEEWKRLIYVAYTRAEVCLAVPVWGSWNRQSASPVKNFLNAAMENLLPQREHDSSVPLYRFFDADYKNWLTEQTGTETKNAEKTEKKIDAKSLKGALENSYQGTYIADSSFDANSLRPRLRQKITTSFTALSRLHDSAHSSAHFHAAAHLLAADEAGEENTREGSAKNDEGIHDDSRNDFNIHPKNKLDIRTLHQNLLNCTPKTTSGI